MDAVVLAVGLLAFPATLVALFGGPTPPLSPLHDRRGPGVVRSWWARGLLALFWLGWATVAVNTLGG